MKIIIGLFCAALLSVNSLSSQPTVPDPFEKSLWLVGTWVGEYKGKPFYETWRKEGDKLICYSIDIKGADTTIKQIAAIVTEKGSLIYRSQIDYPATRIMANDLTFEAQTTRGLSRLVWAHTPQGHWLAVLQHPNATIAYDLTRVAKLDAAVTQILIKQKAK
jgi:hypothetical protein